MTVKLKRELKAMGLAMAFFGLWIGALILLKTLLLESYNIDFVGWSKIIVGALLLSKVVLILERVTLGAWVRACPAWVDTLLRTGLYTMGLALILILERALKGHHEPGGVEAAVTGDFHGAELPHVLVNTICLSGALFVYNALTVVRHHLSDGGLLRLFLLPIPDPEPAKTTSLSPPNAGSVKEDNRRGPSQ